MTNSPQPPARVRRGADQEKNVTKSNVKGGSNHAIHLAWSFGRHDRGNFHLKFATTSFLPSLADPYAVIYAKHTLDTDPHWFEQNVMGSGPFRFVSYEIGPSHHINQDLSDVWLDR